MRNDEHSAAIHTPIVRIRCLHTSTVKDGWKLAESSIELTVAVPTPEAGDAIFPDLARLLRNAYETGKQEAKRAKQTGRTYDMSDAEPTVDDAFADAIAALDEAHQAVETLRSYLRYRTLTTKDADQIRRMTLRLANDEVLLGQLRSVALERARREGTLA